MLLAVLAAGIDNYVVPPMLLAIADEFDRSLGGVAAVAAAYVFAYGAMQLGWGFASDRIGRLAVIRTGLGIGAVATLGSAFAGDMTLLIVLRGVAGAAFAAVAPSAITYIGDSVAPERRAGTLSDLVAVYSGGVALGIVCGGVASDVASWRVGFLSSAAVAGLALAVQLRYGRDTVAVRRSPMEFARSIGRTIGSTWPRAVALLALFEGAALIGFLTFFPAALEESGVSRRSAGLVVALYGVAIAVVSRPLRRLAGRWRRGVAMAIGMLCGAAALGMAGASQSVVAIGAAAILIATGFALAHPLLQSWATEVRPAERATAVGLFATGLFVGTAITTQLAAPFLPRMGYGWTFAIGAGVALALSGVLAVSWERYEQSLPAAG